MKFCPRHDMTWWLVQIFVVIGRVDFKSEHCKFWSNFEFNRNITEALEYHGSSFLFLQVIFVSHELFLFSASYFGFRE